APARLPPVVPENVPIQRVHRPRIVGRRDLEDAVHLQNRSRQTRRAAGGSGNVHRIFRHTPGDRRRRRWRKESPFATAGSSREAADPREGEVRSEEHTSELQSRVDLVCRLLLEKKKSISSSIDTTSRFMKCTYAKAA